MFVDSIVQLLLNKYDYTTCCPATLCLLIKLLLCYLVPKKPNNSSLEVANEIRAAADRANRSHNPSIRDVIMNRVSQLRRRY